MVIFKGVYKIIKVYNNNQKYSLNKKPKRKIKLVNTLILIFTIIIMLLIFEASIKFLDLIKASKQTASETNESKIRMGTNSSLILSSLKPDSSMFLAGAHVKINSLGFRDYEYSLKKPSEVFRIAVLGDSFTFGYGIEIGETYSKQLENKLNEENKEKKYEVLNFGGNGGNTLLEAEYLKERVLEFEPDLVIVGFFLNDADSDYIFDQEYCLNNSKELSKKNNFLLKSESYKFVVDKFKSIKKKIEVKSDFGDDDYYFLSLYQEEQPGFICFKEGVRRFSKISQNKNLTTIFIIIPLNTRKEIYQGIYQKVISVVNLNNLTIFNLYSYFKEYEPSELTTGGQYPHYNYLGNKIIAEALYGILKNNSYI